MIQMGRLIGIGIAAGAILAGMMQLIYLMTGSQAYILLYNVDYIPLVHRFQDIPGFGVLFHFIFCIVSVVGLFYLLHLAGLAYRVWPYVAVYTAGSGILYFLTLFTERPPAAADAMAWFYWTFSHLIFSFIVGYMVKWTKRRTRR